MSSETHEKCLRDFRKLEEVSRVRYVWLWEVRGMCVDLENDPDIRNALNTVVRAPRSDEPPKGFPFGIERVSPGLATVMAAWTARGHREVNRKISRVLAALWYTGMFDDGMKRFWMEMRDQILDLIRVYVASAASAVKWGREVGVDKQSVPKEALFVHDYIVGYCTDEKYEHMFAEFDTSEKKEKSMGVLFARVVSSEKQKEEEEEK